MTLRARLLRGLGVLAGLVAACTDGPDAPAPPPPPGPEAAPFAVTRDAFLVNGEPALLLGVDILYYRMAPEEWRDRLAKARSLGFNVLQTYVPWNFHEPVEGAFDFSSPDHDLGRYLDLAHELGFLVILRPGPHVFNEWDGGGEPAWLFARAAETAEADGLYDFRDADSDYLAAVARYFSEVNAVARPRLATADPPGPIVLYQLDNEYDFFALLKEVVHFNHLGLEAAGSGARVAEYFATLRDMVRADGIDVPLVTCPTGTIEVDGRVLSFTGDVPDILPAANLYAYLDSLSEPASPPFETGVRIEAEVARRVAEMRDPDRLFHGGAYAGWPSFAAETDVSVTGLGRHVFGGNEGAVLFNFAGAVTPHQMNMVFLNAAAGLSAQSLLGAEVSYYPSVVDFRAPIAPGGMLRPVAFELRRLNGLLGAFSRELASAGEAFRTGPNRNDGGALEVAFRDAVSGEELVGLDGLGTAEVPAAPIDLSPGSDIELVDLIAAELDALLAPVFPNDRAVYWLRGAGGESFVWLFNPHPRPIEAALTLDGRAIPAYSTFVVPAGEGSGGAAHEQWGWAIVPADVPLGPGLPTLGYTTSQVLALRDFGGRRLLVVYGEDGTTGEMRLEGGFGPDGAPPQVVGGELADRVLEVHERGLQVFRYAHASDRALVLRYPSGAELEILTTTRDEAGHWWFGRDAAGRDLALTDAAWVERAAAAGSVLTLDVWRRPGSGGAHLLTPVRPAGARGPLDETVDLAAWDPDTWLLPLWPFQPAPQAGELPPLPDPGATLVTRSEDALPNERDPLFDFAAGPYVALAGGPAPLEADEVSVLRGHAWYATTFDLPGGGTPLAAEIRIEGAADFVATYVNGTYAGTVVPAGAPDPASPSSAAFTGDSLHVAIDPALLEAGPNALAFRVQVWGHGHAYLPALADVTRLLDELTATYGFSLPIDFELVLPSTMFYSYRGLWGADDATGDYAATLMPYSDPSEPAAARAEVVVDGAAIPLDGTWWVTRGEVDGPGGVLDGTGRLTGERLGWAEPALDAAAAGFAPAALPLAVPDGGTTWARATFATDDLPRAAAGALLPVALRLEGRSLTAAVWLNGRFAGRWISDADWLAQGAPVPGVRDAFLPPEVPRDDLPLSDALLAPPGSTNVVAIVLEDQSPPGSADLVVSAGGSDVTVSGTGTLEGLSLVLAAGDLRDGTATPILHAKDRFVLTSP